MLHFINKSEFENKSANMIAFLNSLERFANPKGIEFAHIYNLFKSNNFYQKLNQSDKDYVSEVLTIIERYNIFTIKSKQWNLYKFFFETITQVATTDATFLSDLKKYNLYNLEDLCFDLIIKTNGRYVKTMIANLKKSGQRFKNNLETTIKILNLKSITTLKY